MRMVVAAVAALLIAAPAALAKEVSKATVCGAGECVTLTKKDLGGKLQYFAEGGDIAPPPAEGAAHFVVRVTIDAGGTHRFSNHFVPSLNLIRGDQGTWMHMTPEAKATLTEVTKGIPPRSADKLPLSASPDSIGAADPTTNNVVEVFAPAETTVPASSGDGFPWLWLAIGAIGVGAAAALARRLRRRGHPAPAAG